jgi:hypothetical protein
MVDTRRSFSGVETHRPNGDCVILPTHAFALLKQLRQLAEAEMNF